MTEGADPRGHVVAVVVAHDDPSMRETLGKILTEAGCVVLLARDGHEALEMLIDGLQPSFVVLDAELSGVDGCTVARRMSRHPALRRVAVAILAAGARRLPARAHRLQIPLDAEQLLAFARALPQLTD